MDHVISTSTQLQPFFAYGKQFVIFPLLALEKKKNSLTDGYFHRAFILITLLKDLGYFTHNQKDRLCPDKSRSVYNYITFSLVYLTLPKWDMIWWLE
jgi:hypothetical protein